MCLLNKHIRLKMIKARKVRPAGFFYVLLVVVAWCEGYACHPGS